MKKLISVVLALALVLSLSAVAFAYEAPAGVNSLAIVGQDIPGVGNWNPADAAGDFELVADNVYEKVIEVTAATTMTVKFAGNDKWDDSCNLGGSYNGDPITIGEVKNLTNGSGAQNMSLTVDEACTLKFTVDMTAGVNSATVLVEKVVEEEDGGEEEIVTYTLAADDQAMLVIPGSSYVNVVVDATAGDVGLSIQGSPKTYLDIGKRIIYPDQFGCIDFTLPGGSVYTLKVGTFGTEGEYAWASTASMAPGSYNNPAELVIGSNSADIAASDAYYYTWTATEDGELTLAIDTAACSDWYFTYDVIASNIYGDTYYTSKENGLSSVAFTVKAGNTVSVTVSTDSYEAGTVVLIASFVAGSTGGEEGGEEGDETGGETGGNVESGALASVTDEAVTATAPWTFTFTAESTGVLNVQVSDNVAFKIFGLEGADSESLRLTASSWSAGTDSNHVVTVPGQITVMVWCWGGSTFGEIDGNISCTLTFTPDEVEVTKEEYIVSGTILDLGENAVTMEEKAENTLFEFKPSETGIYTFTAPEGVLIGNWGQFFNPMDYTADKTNTLEWECTAVGQSILIGVVGSEDTTITVAKKGEIEETVEVEWTDYENTANLDEFVLPEDEEGATIDLVQVDVTDDVADVAVLGEDGYYHLNTADGPILLVDMNEYIFAATGYGNVGRIEYDENGNVVSKVLYNNAIAEYYSCSDSGIYPLTADLMEFYKYYGASQGWYDADIPGFYLFGDVEVDPETAWMFCCFYNEDVTSLLSSYYVAGQSGLCGSNWTPGDAANQMIMNADGTCTITYENVAAGEYQFKITQTSWDEESWGGDGPDGNYVINLGYETYVTIVFNPATGEIAVSTGENPETSDFSIAGLVVAMMAATAGAVVIGKKKEF